MLNNNSEVVNFLTIYRPWFNSIIYPLTGLQIFTNLLRCPSCSFCFFYSSKLLQMLNKRHTGNSFVFVDNESNEV